MRDICEVGMPNGEFLPERRSLVADAVMRAPSLRTSGMRLINGAHVSERARIETASPNGLARSETCAPFVGRLKIPVKNSTLNQSLVTLAAAFFQLFIFVFG